MYLETTPDEKINKLYEDIKVICISHRCDIWKNSWMWDDDKNIIYHHLITLNNRELNYRNIDNLDITLTYNRYQLQNQSQYRIDIRDNRKDIHHFWLFDDTKFILVETYIKEIIQDKYDSLQKSINLINLSKGAYYDIQPDELYQKMNVKLRIKKLLKINRTR